MDRRDCIVIGAGIVGTSCAWHLAREGLRVTLVDRLEPGRATSYGNAACISPSHVVPFSHPGVWKKLPRWLLDPLGPLTVRWRELHRVAPWLLQFCWQGRSWERVRRTAEAQALLMRRVTADYDHLLAAAGLEALRESRGLIVVHDSAEDFEAEGWAYAIKEELGFAWEYVGPGELEIIAPALRPGAGPTLYVPSWQHVLDPGGLAAGIAEDCFRAGAKWVRDEVTGVGASADGVRLDLASGAVLEAGQLVVAAGPWSNRLAAQLDRRVPLAAKRGYHSQVANPGIELRYPVMSGSRSFVMTPLRDGLRLAGTAEFAALDAEPDYRRAKVLTGHARHYFPDLQLGEVSEWMGQRPMMADSLPVISRSPRHRNVFYAFGHGHYGLTQGPTTGALIADLVRGREPGIDMAPFRFERFGGQ